MRHTWNWLRFLGITAALLSLLFGSTVSGVAHEGEDHGATPAASPGAEQTAAMPGHPAHIHPGSCDQLDPAPLHTLTNLQFPPEPNGTPTSPEVTDTPAIPVMTSVTTLDATLADLLAGGHAIDIHASAEQPDVVLACGGIGGTPSGDDLYIGLRAQNSSAHAGIAWLHQNQDGTTTVTLMLAHGLAGAEGS